VIRATERRFLAGYGLRGVAIALVATAVATVAPMSYVVPSIMVATAAVSVET
jgi:hypothetical protein